MKKIIIFLSLIVAAQSFAGRTCLEAKPDPGQIEHLLYLGNNHWLTVVGEELIELSNDKIVSKQSIAESLSIVCGQKNHVIAFNRQKIMQWESGKLTDLKLPFVGRVNISDGVVVYSTGYDKGEFSLYINNGGGAKKITQQNDLSGTFYGGYFSWSNLAEKTTFVFKNDRAIKKHKIPEGANFDRVLDYKSCPNDALFVGGDNFYVRSRFGTQNIKIDHVITKIDYPKGCGEYLVLRDDLSFEKGTIWSLKPGKKLSFEPIPSPCSVDYFVANEDGSLFYWCGKRFYYKNKARTNDVFLGEASQLQLSKGITDRWLATSKDGALYMYLPDTTGKQKESACFVRVTPQKIVDMGCYR